MVASVTDPSGESHLLADVAGAQASGVVGSQHGIHPSIVWWAMHRRCRPGTTLSPTPPHRITGVHVVWGMSVAYSQSAEISGNQSLIWLAMASLPPERRWCPRIHSLIGPPADSSIFARAALGSVSTSSSRATA